MDWISKLEKKFGRFATPNLMIYIIILYGVGFFIDITSPSFYLNYLSLNAEAILQGQVWRILTFLVKPPTASWFFVLFALYLYYMIGRSLEAVWGAFRFNLYFWSGVCFHVIAAIAAYLIFRVRLLPDTTYLNLSLFFAFAAVYPEMKFRLYFLIPIKVKYLAWLNAAFFGYTILQAFLPMHALAEPIIVRQARALAAAVSLLNFMLYYFSSRKRRSPTQRKQKKKFEEDMRQARVAFQEREKQGYHKCEVCGKTDVEYPDLVFRYCSKCEGGHEYCEEHLYTHEHHKGETEA